MALLSVLGWSLLVTAPSQAASARSTPASTITVTTSPSTIQANGPSQSTATATGFPPLANVVFTSSDTNVIGPTTFNILNGTYSAQITSTATITGSPTVTGPAPPVTITASDGTSSGQGQLIQSGPAATVSVGLTMPVIAANGTSTTTAIAIVTDSFGNPVSGDSIVFTSSDLGDGITTLGDNGDGTYTATITSSTTPSTPPGVTITATDQSTPTPFLKGTAKLVQYGSANTVALTLAPTSIIANGTSTSTATTKVTDINTNPVPGQTIVLSSTDPGETITQPPPTGSTGTSVGTIQSSTTVGTATITAADSSAPGKQGLATLVQTVGPATNVAVVLSPTSIPASGLSTTTATATVTDAQSHPISGDNVVFVSSDPGEIVSPTTAVGGNTGRYTATVTSSTTPGPVQIIAVDLSVLGGPHGQATLTQTTGPSTTVLTAVPGQSVTNQTLTLIGTVTVSLGSPSGTIDFENGGVTIAGCGGVPVAPATTGNSAATATCQTAFGAIGSPLSLTAVFTPSAGNLGGSTSPVDSLTVGQDSTATSLAASSTGPTTGSTVTYLVSVTPTHPGATQPSGTVQFSDGTTSISGCAAAPVIHGSSFTGTVAAVCRVSYPSPGTHVITARYVGDGNFTASASSSISTNVHRPPAPSSLQSRLNWSFVFTLGAKPGTTNVSQLMATGVPVGASVQIKCRGRGCPYTTRSILVSNTTGCKTTKTRRCTRHRSTTVDAVAAFGTRRLHARTTLRVEIIRPGWIGKYYLFTMRAGRAPSQRFACLAPGSSKPRVSC